VLPPGDNLVAEGIPPIPAALAAEVGLYTESRSAVLLDWHPGRRSMLIRTRFAEAAHLHQVMAPGGARSQLTFFREPVGDAEFEPVRGEYLVFHAARGQAYRFQFSRGKRLPSVKRQPREN